MLSGKRKGLIFIYCICFLPLEICGWNLGQKSLATNSSTRAHDAAAPTYPMRDPTEVGRGEGAGEAENSLLSLIRCERERMREKDFCRSPLRLLGLFFAMSTATGDDRALRSILPFSLTSFLFTLSAWESAAAAEEEEEEEEFTLEDKNHFSPPSGKVWVE